MTVSLEEAVKGGEKRVRLPSGKELNVKIPAGVASGQQIRLRGQGETVPGHRPGDLLITVTVAPHPFFKVDGSDLRVDLPITLYEAVLGGKVRVPTLGGAVELSIPKNTSSGRTFRLKGKGIAEGRRVRRSVRHHAHHPARRQRCRARGADAEVARRAPLQSAPRVSGIAQRRVRDTTSAAGKTFGAASTLAPAFFRLVINQPRDLLQPVFVAVGAAQGITDAAFSPGRAPSLARVA